MKTDKIKKDYEKYEDEVLAKLDKLCDEIGLVQVEEQYKPPIHQKQMRNYSKKRQRMKQDKLFETGKALGI